MSGFSGVEEEKDYVSLKDVKVEFNRDDYVDADGFFTLCFWVYIHNCFSFPSTILVQKHQDVTSTVPFLWLDKNRKMRLFPFLFLNQEAQNPEISTPWMGLPCASTEIEFSLKKWVHVGCEILQNTVRLNIDGEIVGEKPLSCSLSKDLHTITDVLKQIYLACPEHNEELFEGYVHGLDVLSPTSAVKDHYTKDPPVRLSIDHSSASEIEEDNDGVWSIVGGKSSCRRIFSLDVTLLDAFGSLVNKDLEVVASLLYADNEALVENTSDEEPPLLMNYDGVEYASHDRPCKLIKGRASFKLKISQLSSKCNNRLFRIRFEIPELGRYPCFETLSLPIQCVSRSKNTRVSTITWRKSSNRMNYMNGLESPSVDDGSIEVVPNIVREAKQCPSKRIKLGHDKPFAMFKEELKQANTGHEENTYRMSNGRGVENNNNGGENNSCGSNSSEATDCDPKSMHVVSSPISDLIIFKYCMGGPAERCNLLKEIALSASKEQLANFANQVSVFSGCLHHWHQINMAKRLVDEGIHVWTSIAQNNHHVLWENLVPVINKHFTRIASCNRSLTRQDFDCLRRIAGCRDIVSQENFERMWSWLYPVAFTLSQNAVNPMWDSLSPVWFEGFITKEEAESALVGPGGGLHDPGTFVLRFPTSRIWPHPDAGNLVVTYVGSDYTIHHRLLSFDFINSSTSKEMTAKPLQDMLLDEPELSRLGRVIRGQ